MKKTEKCELKTFFNPHFYGRRLTMKKMYVLMMVLVIGFCVSGAQAAWVDNFESYPISWSAIPSPWETGSGESPLYVQGTNGYGPSRGVGGPSNWDWGYQYRPTDGETVTQLYGKVFASSGSTWSNAYISLLGSKSHTADRVSIGLQSEGEHTITLIFIAATSGDDNRHQIWGLSEDTWYDVRISSTGNNWLGEYKEVSSSTWISAGTVTPYSNFDDTYVGMAAQRGGGIDDVGYVPEPATIGLLSLGFGLVRRRR